MRWDFRSLPPTPDPRPPTTKGAQRPQQDDKAWQRQLRCEPKPKTTTNTAGGKAIPWTAEGSRNPKAPPHSVHLSTDSPRREKMRRQRGPRATAHLQAVSSRASNPIQAQRRNEAWWRSSAKVGEFLNIYFSKLRETRTKEEPKGGGTPGPPWGDQK